MSFSANASGSLGLKTQSPGFSEREGHSPSSAPEGITVISFDAEDPDNPVNWSTRRKNFVVFLGIVAIINSTLDSSLPSGAIDYIADEFHVRNKVQLVLPISLYLIGYVLGPLFFGPLSETFGRRIVMVPTFALFTIFTLACAAAPNWCAFLIFRFICGVGASSAIAVTGGMYADIYSDPRARGRAIALFISATAFGPQFAPIISGFVSPEYGWRWTFWIGFIIAGISFIPMLFLPETYGSVILLKRAQKMRKEISGCKVYAAIELENRGIEQMVTITLARPLRMLFTEPIVLFSCLYLSMATAIFFLFFEAYPLIFRGIYGMSTGIAGLAFLPIAVGACIAFSISLWYDSILQSAKTRNAPWVSVEEYRRLPLACLGGPLYVISLFWLGWTATASIHWIVPMLAGLPFGVGFVLIFMSLLNYMADAYQEFSASAAAAAGCCRSLFGAVLPLAAAPLYEKLGIAWGNSLLGFISLVMTIVPFAFIRFGERIRASSRMSRELLER